VSRLLHAVQNQHQRANLSGVLLHNRFNGFGQ
jgi:hypothetical protein